MRLLLLEKAYSDLDIILLDGNTTQMEIILLKQKRWHIHPAMWYSVSNELTTSVNFLDMKLF